MSRYTSDLPIRLVGGPKDGLQLGPRHHLAGGHKIVFPAPPRTMRFDAEPDLSAIPDPIPLLVYEGPFTHPDRGWVEYRFNPEADR